jgi:hypothetical protein
MDIRKIALYSTEIVVGFIFSGLFFIFQFLVHWVTLHASYQYLAVLIYIFNFFTLYIVIKPIYIQCKILAFSLPVSFLKKIGIVFLVAIHWISLHSFVGCLLGGIYFLLQFLLVWISFHLSWITLTFFIYFLDGIFISFLLLMLLRSTFQRWNKSNRIGILTNCILVAGILYSTLIAY